MSLPLPTQIWLTTGNACNYKCIFCENRNQIKTPFMPLKMIQDLFDFFGSDCTVDLSGYGEFLLHPNFNEIIKIAIDKQIGLQLVVNGELLTKEKRDLLKQCNLKLINFSLNSLIPSTKHFLSGNCGSYDIVMENFYDFVKKPRDYQATISMVINRYNFREMPLFAQFGIDYEVDMVKFLHPVLNIQYDKDFVLLNDEEERIYSHFAYEILKNSKMKFIGLRNFEADDPYSCEIKKKDITRCNSAWHQTVIDQKGNVFPCCYLPGYIVGNLNEMSFGDIWNGEKMERLRNAIKRGCKNEFCKNCMDYK